MGLLREVRPGRPCLKLVRVSLTQIAFGSMSLLANIFAQRRKAGCQIRTAILDTDLTSTSAVCWPIPAWPIRGSSALDRATQSTSSSGPPEARLQALMRRSLSATRATLKTAACIAWDSARFSDAGRNLTHPGQTQTMASRKSGPIYHSAMVTVCGVSSAS